MNVGTGLDRLVADAPLVALLRILPQQMIRWLVLVDKYHRWEGKFGHKAEECLV